MEPKSFSLARVGRLFAYIILGVFVFGILDLLIFKLLTWGQPVVPAP